MHEILARQTARNEAGASQGNFQRRSNLQSPVSDLTVPPLISEPPPEFWQSTLRRFSNGCFFILFLIGYLNFTAVELQDSLTRIYNGIYLWWLLVEMPGLSIFLLPISPWILLPIAMLTVSMLATFILPPQVLPLAAAVSTATLIQAVFLSPVAAGVCGISVWALILFYPLPNVDYVLATACAVITSIGILFALSVNIVFSILLAPPSAALQIYRIRTRTKI